MKYRKFFSQIIKHSSFIFKENHVFIEEEDNSSDKFVKVQEELDGIDIDGIGDLVDLPKLMYIDKECGDLQVVIDSEQLTRNNNKKRNSEVLQAYRCPLCDKFIEEVEVSIIFLVVIFFL